MNETFALFVVLIFQHFRGKSEETALPKAMLSIIDWLTKIFSAILEAHFTQDAMDPQHQKIVNSMVKLANKILKNPFLMSVLYIAKQEDNDRYNEILKKFNELNNVLSNSQFKNFNQAKDFEELLKKILTENNIVNELKTNDENIEAITYCLQPLIAIEVQKNPCQSTEDYVKRFLTIRQLKNYPLPRLYYEIIRASLISVSNVNGTSKESTWCAFAFIKVPQIIKQIHADSSV